MNNSVLTRDSHTIRVKREVMVAVEVRAVYSEVYSEVH
jgi:hypothetical protein